MDTGRLLRDDNARWYQYLLCSGINISMYIIISFLIYAAAIAFFLVINRDIWHWLLYVPLGIIITDRLIKIYIQRSTERRTHTTTIIINVVALIGLILFNNVPAIKEGHIRLPIMSYVYAKVRNLAILPIDEGVKGKFLRAAFEKKDDVLNKWERPIAIGIFGEKKGYPFLDSLDIASLFSPVPEISITTVNNQNDANFLILVGNKDRHKKELRNSAKFRGISTQLLKNAPANVCELYTEKDDQLSYSLAVLFLPTGLTDDFSFKCLLNQIYFSIGISSFDFNEILNVYNENEGVRITLSEHGAVLLAILYSRDLVAGQSIQTVEKNIESITYVRLRLEKKRSISKGAPSQIGKIKLMKGKN